MLNIKDSLEEYKPQADTLKSLKTAAANSQVRMAVEYAYEAIQSMWDRLTTSDNRIESLETRVSELEAALAGKPANTAAAKKPASPPAKKVEEVAVEE